MAKQPRRADKVVFIRLTSDEHDRVKHLAEAYGVSVTQLFKTWAFGPKVIPVAATPQLPDRRKLSL